MLLFVAVNSCVCIMLLTRRDKELKGAIKEAFPGFFSSQNHIFAKKKNFDRSRCHRVKDASVVERPLEILCYDRR